MDDRQYGEAGQEGGQHPDMELGPDGRQVNTANSTQEDTSVRTDRIPDSGKVEESGTGQVPQPGDGGFGDQGGAPVQPGYGNAQGQAGVPTQPYYGNVQGQGGTPVQPGYGSVRGQAGTPVQPGYGSVRGQAGTPAQPGYGSVRDQAGTPAQPGYGGFQGQSGQPGAAGQNGYNGQSGYNGCQQGYPGGQSYAGTGVQISDRRQYYMGQQVYQQKWPPQEKNSNNKVILIAIVSIIAVLGILFVILLSCLTYKITSGASRSVSDFREESQDDDFWGKSDKKGQDEQQNDSDNANDGEEYDEDAVYGTTPDADYYSGLTDSINTTTDYKIEWENYTFTDEDNAAYIQVDYAQIVGDTIPNLDNINENLEAYAKEVVDYYDDFSTGDTAEEGYLEVYSTSYVTYNDDARLSVVMYESIFTQDLSYGSLVTLNVDLINGKLVWNTEVLDLDDEFVEEFRRQIKIQNNVDLDLSDKEIYEAMSDEDMLILFYTPVGLEVGINFIDEYGQMTWITATFKDYYKYTKTA